MRFAYVTIIVILVLVLALGWLSQRHLEDLSVELCGYADAASAAIYAEDWPSALAALQNLQALWEKHAPLVEIMLNHARVDDITRTVAGARAYVATNERGDAFAQVALLRIMCKYIGDIEKVTLTNVL